MIERIKPLRIYRTCPESISQLEITYKEFPLYVRGSKGGKHVKINGQSIYNGKVSKYHRNNMVIAMQCYLWQLLNDEKNRILRVLEENDIPKKNYSFRGCTLQISFKVPMNIGNVRLNKFCKIVMGKKFVNFDLDNFSLLWKKVFQDTLVSIFKDHFDIDDGILYIVKTVEDIHLYYDRPVEDRAITFTISYPKIVSNGAES